MAQTQRYTVTQAAKMLGRHRTTILRATQRLCMGISAGPGTPVYLTAAEIERLRRELQEGPGNPDLQDPATASRLGQRGAEAHWYEDETA